MAYNNHSYESFMHLSLFNMSKTNLHTNDFHIIKAIVIQDQQGNKIKWRYLRLRNSDHTKTLQYL